jgi:glutathione S-transferase
MRGSVHILVPKLIAKMGLEGIDKICRERNCQARGSSGEHSKVIDRIDVSNWRRLGFPEYELVSDMINAANYLAQLEDEIPEFIFHAAEAKSNYTGPKLKLVYFDFRGRAEPIRWAFTLGNVPFEDKRLQYQEFQQQSDAGEFAYASVPTLYVGDQQIGQSGAALRFAGKAAGLYPKDDLVAGQVDAVLDCIKQLEYKLEPSLFAEGDVKKALRTELLPTLNEFFNYLEHALARNKSGSGYYFEHLSIADVASAIEANRYLDGDFDHVPTTILDEYPRLKAHHDKIYALPQIVAWRKAHA